MDEHTSHEQAYKNGYEAGKRDAVKHGRWKGAGLGDYLCSVCWEVFSGGNKYNFCPNCGADMRRYER